MDVLAAAVLKGFLTFCLVTHSEVGSVYCFQRVPGSEVCLKLQMAEKNAKECIEAILKLFTLISSLDMCNPNLIYL